MAEAESLAQTLPRQTGHVFGIALVFLVVAIGLQFWPRAPLPYHIGERAPIDLRSPVEFTVVDDRQTEILRRATREMTPAVLVADAVAFNHIYAQLNNLKYDVQGARNLGEVPADDRKHFPALSEESLHHLQQLNPNVFEADVRALVNGSLPYMPFVSKADFDKISERRSSQVTLTTQPTLSERVVEWNVQDVIALGNMDGSQARRLRSQVAQSFPESLVETIASYFTTLDQPNYRFDAKLTQQLAERRVASMKPFGMHIRENDVIVPRGNVINADQYQMLVQAQKHLSEEIAAKRPWEPWLAGLGRAVMIAILTLGGAYYTSRLTDVPTTVTQGWTVCLILLAALVPARVVATYWPQMLYLVGIAPPLLAALVLTIGYNRRYALGVSAVYALIVTITLGQSIDFFLAALSGIGVLCFSLREVRTLGRLLEVGAFAAAAIFATVWALGASRLIGSGWTPWIAAAHPRLIAAESLWGAAAVLPVYLFTLVFLGTIERIFHVTTAMKLLEWADANKPLLRRLAHEASGTFNHSLTVGILAEAAANAIGANGLLCRVGAYYHDVGKLSKPQYFIENQGSGGVNRHDKLSPAMSLLIIVGHVKDGIELAREYGLPRVVHQFIAQHHGTTLVEYFYHAARKKAEQRAGTSGDIEEVSETEFRYPGPRPQTREAAIVMICDACESVVRSIDEPTPGRIESAVHGIIMKRLMDGQFAECDLTLRDLSKIEETLIRTLAGVHHGRVAYPTDNPKPAVSQPA